MIRTVLQSSEWWLWQLGNHRCESVQLIHQYEQNSLFIKIKKKPMLPLILLICARVGIHETSRCVDTRKRNMMCFFHQTKLFISNLVDWRWGSTNPFSPPPLTPNALKYSIVQCIHTHLHATLSHWLGELLKTKLKYGGILGFFFSCNNHWSHRKRWALWGVKKLESSNVNERRLFNIIWRRG